MITSRTELVYYLNADKHALGIKTQSFQRKLLNLFFPNEILKFERLLRYAEYYSNKSENGFQQFFYSVPKFYYRYCLRRQSIKLGFSIPLNVFGPGLSIAHYGTIVVNGNAKIGANCRIHSSVNIGASAGNKEAPVIGDNCYIGPGAIIYGNIHIANNTTISANSTVNHSFHQEYVALGGTPAIIIKTGMKNWLEFNNVSF